ncbi:MAG: hypothetical protein R3277_01390 [Brumimicrobium sp.]|nr:hypothetical protein [Brumimicrobium sp.]
MMKEAKLILIFLLMCCADVRAQTDSLFLKGVKQLSESNYSSASESFLKDIRKKPGHDAFYNLGMAYAGKENWLKSLWAFESALKYRPGSSDAAYNAALVYEKLENTSSDWENPFSWSKRLLLGFGSSIWGGLSFIFGLISGLAIFILLSGSENYKYRKFSKFSLLPSIVLFVLCFYSFMLVSDHYRKDHYLYASGNGIQTHVSPGGIAIEENLESYVRYEILESRNGWFKILTKNDRTVWVSEKNVLSY